jgi:hypothetical protein
MHNVYLFISWQAAEIYAASWHRCPLVLLLDGPVYLATVYLDAAWRIDSDTDIIALYLNDIDDDIITDHDLLLRLACKY